jgi:hypothetical protein
MRVSFGFLLVLAGCASGPLAIDEIDSTEHRISADDAVDVYLSKSDWTRIDPYLRVFGKDRHGIATGGIWRLAFHGGASDPPLRIKSAVLTESLAAGGFTTRYTYTVECELTYRGRLYPIRAEGTRAAAMMTLAAMRQAVELGVADAARKARVIIEPVN